MIDRDVKRREHSYNKRRPIRCILPIAFYLHMTVHAREDWQPFEQNNRHL